MPYLPFLLLLILCSPVHADASAFWQTWSDGQAEVSGYRLVQPRYGQSRTGHAVLIYVTEPFSRKKKVKVDRYTPNNPDHFTVLKLNHLQRFQTGVYDYSVMTSVFADPSQGFRPVKQTFTAQEWCGHVFEETLWTDAGAAVRVDSYFEGETTQETRVGTAASEDALWIIARGLAAGGAGQAIPGGPTLGRSLLRRLRHQPIKTFDGRFVWGPAENVEVPAGRFKVRPLTWSRGDRVTCTLRVEVEKPYRIIGWSCSDGETAELTGSTRMPYWQKVTAPDEALLKVLGLPRHAP